MAIYVDDMRARYGRLVMCHMIADSEAELHAMAARIGVARRWHQAPPRVRDSHYDIALSKRALALAAGAVPITMRQAAAMCARRRATGQLGPPEDALAWYAARLPATKPESQDGCAPGKIGKGARKAVAALP